MAKRRTKLQTGRKIPLDVTQEIIDLSTPCCKQTCVLSNAAIESLKELFGSKQIRVRSTDAGISFPVDGYRYEGRFAPVGVKRLHRFDSAFDKARKKGLSVELSIESARKALTPFKTNFIIAGRAKVAPPMSDSDKKRLRDKKAKDRKAGLIRIYPPKARQLSV